MNVPNQQLRWIGIIGGFVEAIVINVAPLHFLLPINRILFALICSLLAIWLLALVTKSWDDKP